MKRLMEERCVDSQSRFIEQATARPDFPAARCLALMQDAASHMLVEIHCPATERSEPMLACQESFKRCFCTPLRRGPPALEALECLKRQA